MRIIFSIATTIAITLNCSVAFTQYSNIEFVENKGQWDDRVKYKGLINNGAFFLQNKGFKVLQVQPDDLKKVEEYYHGTRSVQTKEATITPISNTNKLGILVRSHAYEVEFINALQPVITADKPLPSYNNYFIGNDPSKWKSDCKIYQGVNYSNLYKDIDVRYYTSENQLKYDVIVKPGADFRQLKMKYKGVDGLDVRNGQLVIKTSVGEMKELEPFAYQIINGFKKVVDCKFKVLGDVVSFECKDYNPAFTLVIDPFVVFSTFSGSKIDNWGYTATYGFDGTFYGGGIVFGLGFPVSEGAFQTLFAGGNREGTIEGYDIGIIKFNPDGTRRVYATYIGGKGNEQPHSLVADAQGNLVIGGRSNSQDFPVTKTDAGGGEYDIILTKLNAAGTAIIGSRKIGGSANDGVNINPKFVDNQGAISIKRNYGDDARSEVILDNNNNIWLASNTKSSNFPTSTNAFQKNMGGDQDAVIIKADPNLDNFLLSTYLGGTKKDAAFVLALNPSDNSIYVGGNTESEDIPGNKTGVIYPSYQSGETDGFISIISNDGGTLSKTTFIGTDAIDMLYGIQFDKFGYPYIMGTTTGSWPILNAKYSVTDGRQFIAKLRPDLSAYEYSTVFGPAQPTRLPNLSPVAFLIDRCENVYVSGWGGQVNVNTGYPNSGTGGLPITNDAIQSTTDGSDFYFFVLERDAQRILFASYFGQDGGLGEHVDGGTSRFDRQGVIYQGICANCGADVRFPTTPNVWSPNNGSQNCNLAAVKIAFNLAGVFSSIRPSIAGVKNDTIGCVPLTVDFTDTIGGGVKYIWNFGDGTGDFTTTDPGLTHVFERVGNFRVRLISIDSTKCNIADTSFKTIIVRNLRANLGFNSRKLQPCEAFNFEFTNTSSITPSGTFGDSSFVWNFGDNTPEVVAGKNNVFHTFPGPGEYNVRLLLRDSTVCNSPADTTITLRIATNVNALFETPAIGCAPYTAVFNNISAGGQSYLWNFGDNTTSTEASPTHLYTTPGAYRVTLRVVDSATCNIVDSTSAVINVRSKPIAGFSFSPDPPQENSPVTFINTSLNATDYLWKFGDGDTLLTQSDAPLQHVYTATGTYNACLIAMTNFGCYDTICKNVSAKIVPIIDVPTAFTPNGDGINDKIFIRSFGVTNLTWKIYNRWGKLVFETKNINQGWDGRFNGAPQPTEVYHYILEASFSDKSVVQKKGDITLIR